MFIQRLFSVSILSVLIMSTNAIADEKLVVFVSILPQQYFVQEVGGEHVDVRVMVGPGQNPATYEPTAQQMAALSKADLYFTIGVPFESAWLDKIKDNNSELKIVECCETISNLLNTEHSHDHGHDHESDYDPHIWTSPKKVMLLAELIKTNLITVDNVNSASYITSTESFIKKITALDNAIRAKVNHLEKRILIVSHPSWSYFSEEYGFKQVSIEQQGKEIQASSMVKLIKIAKDKNIKAIFSQPQFNDKAARIIANEIDAKIFQLDPLAFNYIENLNQVTDNIVKGLSHE